MYFLVRADEGPYCLAEFLFSARVTVHDYAQPDRLLAATSLMAKYSDTPMDYADATLMLLAEDAGIYVTATFRPARILDLPNTSRKGTENLRGLKERRESAVYSGMFPCFLRGEVAALFSSIASASISRARVLRGRMTSSTQPRSAAT